MITQFSKRQRMLLCGLLPVVMLASSSGICPLVVLGSSMEPALLSGQVALLERHYYPSHPLECGDVVAFRWKGRVYVKRVHALAGETVLLMGQQGYWMPVAQKDWAKAQRLARVHPHFRVCTVVVPPDHFFSLGDHLPASVDSRDLGPIPTTAILGRVHSL